MKNRKNFGMLVLFGVVAIGVIALAFFTAAPQATDEIRQNENNEVLTINQQGTSITARADSDGDGIPNWKEVLLGTDPNNVDSDGDGVSDGDEVAQGSDPAVHGTEPISEKPYVAPEGTEPIEALGKELFAAYLSFKENGELSEAELQTAIESVVERNVLDIEPPQYTFEDIQVNNNESGDAIATYASEVQKVLTKAEAVPEHETVTLYKLLDTGDLIHLRQFTTNIALYAEIINDLLAIPTPTTVSGTHLEMINSISAATYAITLMSTHYEDPYRTLLALDAFIAAEDRFAEAHQIFTTITTSS
ncbi:MAG: hypothetical protein ACJKTH_00975 [Patescibacteria group bacterium UBA2163]